MKVRFDQLAINVKEKKKPTEEDRHHYIGLEHLDSGSLTVSRWGADVAPKGEKLLMKKGDVLFGKRRAYQKKVAIAPFDGIFSAHGIVLRPNERIIDKAFFPLFISSDYFLDAAIALSVGSLSPTINWKDLARLEFELPSLKKQRELAKVLWAIEETRTAYQRLEQATDELVKARFVEMFREVPLSSSMLEVCKIITDGTHQPPKFVNEGIPFIFVSNIVNNFLTYEAEKFISEETYNELIKRTPIEIGDVLLSTVGSYGHPAIVESERKFLFQRHIAYLKPDHDKINSRFLHALILNDAVQRQIESRVKGIAQKTLNLSDIKSLQIPLPPLDLQNQFTAFVEQVDKSKLAVQSMLEKNAAMKAAAMREWLG